MREEEFEKLVEKYREGNSSLAEEEVLIHQATHAEPSLEAWSIFVKKNQIETPEELNETLWASFRHRKKSKRIRLIRSLSVAASIVLLISFFMGRQGQQPQSYAEKEQLLNQALGMFESSESKEVYHHVFYENEMIVLYTTTE